ncbi:MAG: cytochrome c biogenesis protein CcdA, partial [Spirochaetes bacterium]
MSKERSIVARAVINTLFFILGFSIIFVALGAGAGSISGFLLRHKKIISIIGGAIIIIFAFQVMDILKIPFLNYEKKAYVKQKPRGIFGALIIGITFAAAWTPCIGPILSSILILAATEETVIKGIYLLIAYSLGLGLPFLFSVIAFGSFLSFSKFIKRHFKTVEIISGILLIGIGIVLILGQFEKLSQMIA